MRGLVAARIMRTTIGIDGPILKDLKRLQRRAAILRRSGVATPYTHDRDFRRFTFLDVRDPLA